jgi:predicted patatin/cPLA2 family phospholipase
MGAHELLGPGHVHTGVRSGSAIDLLLTRTVEGSVRGNRSDGRVLALAVEGGGLRGAISGGMCIVLEAAGLIDAVDVIYGTSSGALNGSFTASGQAALASTDYEATANRQFANPFRFLLRRPVVDLGMLFQNIIRERNPYDAAELFAGPRFHALATNLNTRRAEVLSDFRDVDDLMLAVQVSCSIPLLAGPPLSYDGVPMADGGLLEPIPYRAALAGGATDVIALRSRSASYRARPYPWWIPRIVQRLTSPALADLVRAAPALYNAQAAELEALGASGSVSQITPFPNTLRSRDIETSPAHVRQALTLGGRSAARALGLPDPEFFWEPRPYVPKTDVSAPVLVR